MDGKRFLFTLLPSNDLGLMTRILPIATDLAARWHERESNARRVADVGAGEFVSLVDRDRRSKRELTTEVRSEVRRVLSESSYARQAEVISSKMKEYGAGHATDLIEDLALRTGKESA